MSTTEDDASATTERSTCVGRFSYDTATGGWAWDDHLFRILGLEPRSVAPSIDHVVSHADPDLRANLCHGLFRAQTDGS